MLIEIVRKLAILVKLCLTVLIILLLLPTLARASCSSPSSDESGDIVIVSTMVEGFRQMAEVECGSYSSTVFLEESIPFRLLGLQVSEIAVVMAAEGSVIVSVDVSGLCQDDVWEYENSLAIRLPEPVLTCHSITPRWSIYPRNLPVGSADDIARVEVSMIEEAKSLLYQQAVENHLLDEATAELNRLASDLAISAGYQGEVVLEFMATEKSPEGFRALTYP